MDRALAAAEKAVRAAIADVLGVDDAPAFLRDMPTVDDALRPFVAELAAALRDGDWDCIEESNYFDRFPQEMLGHSDDEHKAWLLEKIADDIRYDDGDNVERLTKRLADFCNRKGMN
jgi:hypothetical protein